MVQSYGIDKIKSTNNLERKVSILQSQIIQLSVSKTEVNGKS